jgi:hypothetical protein
MARGASHKDGRFCPAFGHYDRFTRRYSAIKNCVVAYDHLMGRREGAVTPVDVVPSPNPEVVRAVSPVEVAIAAGGPTRSMTSRRAVWAGV